MMAFTKIYQTQNQIIMDKYTKKYLRLIKQAKSDQEISDIIDKIYTDGFDDGEESSQTLKSKPLSSNQHGIQ